MLRAGVPEADKPRGAVGRPICVSNQAQESESGFSEIAGYTPAAQTFSAPPLSNGHWETGSCHECHGGRRRDARTSFEYNYNACPIPPSAGVCAGPDGLPSHFLTATDGAGRDPNID